MVLIIVVVGVRILALPVLGALTTVPWSSLLLVTVVLVLDFDHILPAKIPPTGYHREVTSWISLQGIDPGQSLPQVSPPQTCSDFLLFLSYIHYGGHFVHFQHPDRHRWRSPMRLWHSPYAQACSSVPQACSSDHVNFSQRRRRDGK